MTGGYSGPQPPPNPYGPPGPAAPPVAKSHWRAQLILVCSVAAVLVLVGGVVAALNWPARNRSAFDAAVTNLAAAQAVHYQSAGSGTSWDARVTSHGEAVGTIDSGGQELAVLAVAGTTLVKFPDPLLAELNTAAPDAVLRGKWITGSDVTNNTVAGPVLKQLLSPAQLAGKVRTALNSRDTEFPAPNDPGTKVDGVLALKASTPAGDVYVTKNAPYRVLRLASGTDAGSRTPDSSSNSPAEPDSPSATDSPSEPASPSAGVQGGGVEGAGFRLAGGTHQQEPSESRPERTPDESDQGDLGNTDLPEMLPGDVDDTYDEAISDTLEASTASVNDDIQFDVDGNVNVDCSPAGCTVSANVSNDASGSPGNTITGGDVAAEMDATVTADGDPAGGCTGTQSLPLNDSGVITCDDPAAGPVIAAKLAQKQAAAQAQADAEAAGGGEAVVPYEVDYAAEAYVTATAQIDAQQQVQQQENEEQAADQATQAGESGTKPPFPPPSAISGATDHGQQQISGRDGGHGVSDAAMQDAVRNPTKAAQYRPDRYGGSYRYVGKDAVVNLNEAGQIITAWARSRAGWRNP